MPRMCAFSCDSSIHEPACMSIRISCKQRVSIQCTMRLSPLQSSIGQYNKMCTSPLIFFSSIISDDIYLKKIFDNFHFHFIFDHLSLEQSHHSDCWQTQDKWSQWILVTHLLLGGTIYCHWSSSASQTHFLHQLNMFSFLKNSWWWCRSRSFLGSSKNYHRDDGWWWWATRAAYICWLSNSTLWWGDNEQEKAVE